MMSLLKIFHSVQTKLQNICGLNAERKARDYSGCGALNISVQRKVGVARAGQAPRTDKYLRSQLGGLTLQSSPASRAEISHLITLTLTVTGASRGNVWWVQGSSLVVFFN